MLSGSMVLNFLSLFFHTFSCAIRLPFCLIPRLFHLFSPIFLLLSLRATFKLLFCALYCCLYLGCGYTTSFFSSFSSLLPHCHTFLISLPSTSPRTPFPPSLFHASPLHHHSSPTQNTLVFSQSLLHHTPHVFSTPATPTTTALPSKTRKHPSHPAYFSNKNPFASLISRISSARYQRTNRLIS